MFALSSGQQVTTGSLAPLDQSQRHGCTARTDGHSWNQAVQRMEYSEYILTGWGAATGVTGRSAGGWANAGAQGRPRGCAEPASSRAGQRHAHPGLRLVGGPRHGAMAGCGLLEGRRGQSWRCT